MSYDLTGYLLRPGVRVEDLFELDLDEQTDKFQPLPRPLGEMILRSARRIDPGGEEFDNGEGFEWTSESLGLQISLFEREASATFSYWERSDEEWERIYGALDGFIRACREHGLIVHDTQLDRNLESVDELRSGVNPTSPKGWYAKIIRRLRSLGG
jgi:hypothetical protein